MTFLCVAFTFGRYSIYSIEGLFFFFYTIYEPAISVAIICFSSCFLAVYVSPYFMDLRLGCLYSTLHHFFVNSGIIEWRDRQPATSVPVKPSSQLEFSGPSDVTMDNFVVEARSLS